MPYTGWCPAGGWAEDLLAPPGLLARYPNLVPTPSADPAVRTTWNVRDSDATIVVTPDGTTTASPGSRLTIDCATETHVRPLHVVDLSDPAAAHGLGAWLAAAVAKGGDPVLDLNVAGPRESEVPGVYLRTRRLLDRAWEAARALALPEG